MIDKEGVVGFRKRCSGRNQDMPRCNLNKLGVCLHERTVKVAAKKRRTGRKGNVHDEDDDSMPVSQRILILTLSSESLLQTSE
jgi:hypothetical protein